MNKELPILLNETITTESTDGTIVETERDHARRRAAQRRTGIQNPGGLEDVFNASQRHGILPQQTRCAGERAKLPLGG